MDTLYSYLYSPIKSILVPYQYYLFITMFWRYYILINIATLLVFAYDKFISGSESRRVPELFLHFLTLCGGFAGAWIGMNILRHKVRLSALSACFNQTTCSWIGSFCPPSGILDLDLTTFGLYGRRHENSRSGRDPE